MNLGARPRGVGFPCATAGSVVSAQDAYYGDIVAERELTCGCQSLEKEFAFASTGVNSPWNDKLSQTKTLTPVVSESLRLRSFPFRIPIARLAAAQAALEG